MSSKRLTNLDILLVEDNEMNTLVASAIIKGTGANITEVDNGMDAIQLLKEQSFDLILMDLHLPVMDGFETVRYIRNSLSNDIPVIAITANVINGEEKKCIEAGMNGFLTKPYTEEELLEKVEACIASGKRTEGNALGQEHLSTTEALYDLSFLESVSKGNVHLLHQMIQVFLDQTPRAIRELKSAYDKRDFSEMYVIAHRVKPDIDNLLILSLKDDIRRIETLALEGKNGIILDTLISNVDRVVQQVVVELKAKGWA